MLQDDNLYADLQGKYLSSRGNIISKNIDINDREALAFFITKGALSVISQENQVIAESEEKKYQIFLSVAHFIEKYMDQQDLSVLLRQDTYSVWKVFS